MSLDLIKKYIKCGLYQEARKLIEKEPNISNLMADVGGGGGGGNGSTTAKSNGKSASDYEDAKVFERVPLLVMLSVVKDEDVAINLSRLLLERGYALNLRDKNGLCAMNYAIALKRFRLLNVYLETFNFELNKFKDCYKNTFLHYAYAINDFNIVELFSKVYSKYYEWDPNSFKFIANCDGLTVQDLYDYMIFLNKKVIDKQMRRAKTSYKDFYIRKKSNESTNTENNTSKNQFIYPESFKFESNPILICKFINHVFHSSSALKSELIVLLNTPNEFEIIINKKKSDINTSSNNSSPNNSPGIVRRPVKTAGWATSNREFKMNILNQIKCINKSNIKPSKLNSSNNPLKKTELISRSLTSLTSSEKNKHLPRIIESRYKNFYKNIASTSNKLDFGPFMSCKSYISSDFTNNGGETWRGEFKSIFNVYSLVSSASYRPSSLQTYQQSNESVLEILGELGGNVRRTSVISNNAGIQHASLNRHSLTPGLVSPNQNQQLASITSKEYIASSSPTIENETQAKHITNGTAHKKSIDSNSSTVILASSTPIISTTHPSNPTITTNNLAISIERKPSLTFNQEPKLEMYLVPGSLLNRNKQRRPSDAKKV
jgi:hypothetical protein